MTPTGYCEAKIALHNQNLVWLTAHPERARRRASEIRFIEAQSAELQSAIDLYWRLKAAE